MSETSNLGQRNGDICFFHKSEDRIGFLVYISLCDNFVVLNSDGSLIEDGSITKNSCCLRCDRHNFDYEEKYDTWKSVRCVKSKDREMYELGEQIDRMFTSLFMDPEKVTLDICPRCYEELVVTGKELTNVKSTELTSSLI